MSMAIKRTTRAIRREYDDRVFNWNMLNPSKPRPYWDQLKWDRSGKKAKVVQVAKPKPSDLDRLKAILKKHRQMAA